MFTREDIKEHNPNWQEIPEHPYRILIVENAVSGKTNASLNLINHEPDIDKIYIYVEDPHDAKYQLLINKTESEGLKYLNDSKAFIEYSHDTVIDTTLASDNSSRFRKIFKKEYKNW